MRSGEGSVREVVGACLRRGVAEFCVCGGARNSSILAALVKVKAKVTVRRFCDERSAAFFALGRMRASGRPVAVVVTSGTAVAEVLPAVMEAHYDGLPLVVISADRPARFRGSGAPQAVEQAGLFGKYAEACVDVEGGDGDLGRLEVWTGQIPVHVNVCLEEPVAAELERIEKGAAIADKVGKFAVRRREVDGRGVGDFLKGARDVLVLVGALPEGSVKEVAKFLEGYGAPVYADATSGLRGVKGMEAVLLRGPEGVFGEERWRKVLRIGGVPTQRLWRDLEGRAEVMVCSVTNATYSGLARESYVVVADPGEVCAGLGEIERVEGTEGKLFERDRRAADEVGKLLTKYPQSEAGLLDAVARVIPEKAPVFLGNSMPVREWNVLESGGKRGRCYANRGANGIDGQLSTFLGTAAGAGEAWGIFGDLTALNDLSAPWVLGQMGKGARRFVIVNNGGGKIFSRLPALGKLSKRVKDMVENPHDIGFADWAAMWGMEHVEVREAGEMKAGEGDGVIELRPDAKQSAAFWRAYERIGGKK